MKVLLDAPDCRVKEYRIGDLTESIINRYRGIYNKMLDNDYKERLLFQVHYFPEDKSYQTLSSCPFLGFLVSVMIGDRENAKLLWESNNLKRYITND